MPIRVRQNRRYTRSAVAASLALALLACAPPSPPAPRFQRISLSVGPCNGVCPEFELSVDENALMRFNGRRNTAVLGSRAETLSEAKFAALKRALQNATFDTLKADYTNEPTCPVLSKGQSERVWLVEWNATPEAKPEQQTPAKNPTSATVRHNAGCLAAPDAKGNYLAHPAALNTLYLSVLEITGVAPWISAGAAKNTAPNP
jgi:hypothetical protein